MTELAHNFISGCRQVYAGIKQLKKMRLSHLRKAFSLMGAREKTAVLALAFLALGNLYLSVRGFYHNHSIVVAGSGGIYSEGFLGQPIYINPLLAYQEPDISLTKLVYSGLYKYDSVGRLVPDLADGQPEISEDLKQYTINLKKNVKWHNGKALTADDVVFTIALLKDPAYKSPLRSMWQSTTVEKLGDYQVKFTTKDVSGPFLHNLTLGIIPQNVWSRVDAPSFLLSNNNLEAVGSGPYAVKEIKKRNGKVGQITLSANNDYHSGSPKVSTFIAKFLDSEEEIVSALHSREITGYGFVALGSSVHLEKSQDTLNIMSMPLPQYQVVFFNLNDNVLRNPNVRKALALATDRRKIIHDVFQDEALLPTSPLLVSGGLASNPQTNAPDINAAAALLDQDGWKIDGKTGLRTKSLQVLELGLVTNDYALNSKAAENLAGQWRQLNIKINLSVVPTKQLTDEIIRPRKFDILLFPEKFDADPDPFPFWHSSQVRDPGLNLTGFSDAGADKLISEARTTTDQQIRSQKYQQFDQMLNEKNPVILLDQTLYTYALDSGLKNVKIQSLYDPSHRFYDIANWYMAEDRQWKW